MVDLSKSKVSGSRGITLGFHPQEIHRMEATRISWLERHARMWLPRAKPMECQEPSSDLVAACTASAKAPLTFAIVDRKQAGLLAE